MKKPLFFGRIVSGAGSRDQAEVYFPGADPAGNNAQAIVPDGLLDIQASRSFLELSKVVAELLV